ncbi:MAG TPA: hypothetical protein VLF89_01055 [Candidatus Saccharimonadales bacterium]|nr:hypothetical protein [Candidatus Saccharimonadales bacterium]
MSKKKKLEDNPEVKKRLKENPEINQKEFDDTLEKIIQPEAPTKQSHA